MSQGSRVFVCVGVGGGPFTVSDEGEVTEINAEQWHEVM